MDSKSQLIQQKVLEITKNLEKEVDAVIDKIDNLDVNDIKALRMKRVQELKELEDKRSKWLQNGHGQYEELAEEKEFFDAIKKSEMVVIHFYTDSNFRCKIMNMHLKILADKHIETRFIYLNAEKCPFLTKKLKIKIIPTVVCIRDTILIDKIIGFTTLGNCDDFTTEMLEWRLAHSEIINYEGDLTTAPDQRPKVKITKGSIREGRFNAESDDDIDIEDFTNKLTEGSPKTEKNFQVTKEEEIELGLGDEN